MNVITYISMFHNTVYYWVTKNTVILYTASCKQYASIFISKKAICTLILGDTILQYI